MSTYGQYERLHVHVAEPDLAVVRKSRRMLSKKGKSREQRDARHAWIRQLIAHHHEWQATCRRYRM